MTKYSKVPFSEIATLIRGVSYDKKVASVLAKDGYIPVLRANNIQKSLVLADLVYVPSDLVKEEQMIRKGDIVLAMSSGSKDLVGKSAQANNDINAAFGTFCGLIRAKDNIDSKFLGLYFQTQEYRNFVSYQSQGVNICNLKKKDIESLQIPLPPLPTQSAIVSRIETLFAELDKATEHLRTAQQQLKTYRQAVLNHWLNNEDGKWEMVPIKEIISVISNGSTPKADKMFSKGEIQFLKVYNLNFDGSINLSKEPVFIERDTHETLLKRSQTKQGDVLINIVGPPLGKVSIIPEGEKEYNINQAIVMFRPNEFVTSKFLAYYLMSPQIIEWLTSTSKATAGQYNVKVSTCREIMFPKVSIQEQQRIVKEIESRLSQATASETYIEYAVQQAEALRQSILKKAFEGELV